jgi:hypothetical protein
MNQQTRGEPMILTTERPKNGACTTSKRASMSQHPLAKGVVLARTNCDPKVRVDPTAIASKKEALFLSGTIQVPAQRIISTKKTWFAHPLFFF